MPSEIMLRENLAALFQLYVKPAAAFGRILDRGRFWFCALAALAVSLLLHASDAGPRFLLTVPSLTSAALLRFISYQPGAYLAPLVAVAIAMVPAIIAVRAILGFGSAGVLIRSDYLPLLFCVLMSWAAAHLPLALARMWIDSEWLDTPLFYGIADFYFVILAGLSVRTVFGTGFGAAFGMAALGWGAGVLGTGLLAVLGGFSYYLMSPLILYFLYVLFGSEVRSLGEGLQSGRRLQQQLEIAATNPHDADAHYQLGLIYQKRRQYTEAIARFERALQIDPEEADAHYQLGRIAREQGRFDDAIRHLKAAAALDDKLSLSEVWRELGAAYLDMSQLDEARAALARYIDRHPYDPEGLYWFGKTLERLHQPAQAREMFERCVEAVETMPSNRKAHVRKWAGQARTGLRGL
jgi:tetratricopeptide (TPR) repeat protein